MFIISSSGFLFRSGTSQSSCGYPTGNKTINFSFRGRFRRVLKAGPLFKGVVVNDDSPAACRAHSKIPTEIDTEISL